jgi:oligopeptide transport system permease protein
MQLRAEPWTYTLIAADGERLVLNVNPEPAISLFEVQLQGLVLEDKEADVLGQKIMLPAHPLGTDQLGRDMLSRIIEGARTSLFVGLVAPLLFIAFGSLYGALAGLLGGLWDDVMMRFADFVVGLPLLLFMILFRVLFGFEAGDSGVGAIIVAMLLLSWPSSARLVRGQVLQMREQPFVQSARLSGASHFYIIRSHLLPNLLPLLLVSLSFAIPQAIFTEAFLSFIGFGVSPPSASWGSLCNDGIKTLLPHPHELLFPALMISVTVLAFNSLGESLRDAVDVKGRQLDD